jgi:hypothetical protein
MSRFSVRELDDGWYVVDTGVIGSHVPGYVQELSGPFASEQEALVALEVWR